MNAASHHGIVTHADLHLFERAVQVFTGKGFGLRESARAALFMVIRSHEHTEEQSWQEVNRYFPSNQ